MPPTLLTDLPPDVVQHIVVCLTLAHHIARAAPTCKVISVAARNAFKVRPFSSEVVTLAGHTNSVSRVAAAPDGRVVTGAYDWSGSYGGIVKVWRDGACERTIQAHTKSVMALAVLPGGARFVSGSLDRMLKVWTLDGNLERTIEVDTRVDCVAALPDGVHFVIGLTNGDVALYGEFRLYHVDGTLVNTFKAHQGIISALAVTPDGQHIISGSLDTRIKVWSIASKCLLSTCGARTSGVVAMAAMPDGQRVLSGGNDRTVRVWLLDGTHQNTFRLDGHLETPDVNALVALADNQHALAGATDKTVKLFNVDNGAVLRTFKHHTSNVNMNCLALLPDGLRFVSGSDDRTVCIVYHGLTPQ